MSCSAGNTNPSPLKRRRLRQTKITFAVTALDPELQTARRARQHRMACVLPTFWTQRLPDPILAHILELAGFDCRSASLTIPRVCKQLAALAARSTAWLPATLRLRHIDMFATKRWFAQRGGWAPQRIVQDGFLRHDVMLYLLHEFRGLVFYPANLQASPVPIARSTLLPLVC